MKLTFSFCWFAFVVGLLSLFASPAVFATMVPSPVTGGSGEILMIDGTDRGSSVTVGFDFAGRNRLGLQFGFVSGDIFNVLAGARGGYGTKTFAGGTIVDFAVRSKGSDGRFGTADDGIFRLSDALYVSEYFSDPVKASKSRHPKVTNTYYETLRLVWDINRDGIRDLTVILNTRNYDGMQSVPATPVPVPAAAWLLGSGLVGLAGVARRKRRCRPSGS